MCSPWAGAAARRAFRSGFWLRSCTLVFRWAGRDHSHARRPSRSSSARVYSTICSCDIAAPFATAVSSRSGSSWARASSTRLAGRYARLRSSGRTRPLPAGVRRTERRREQPRVELSGDADAVVHQDGHEYRLPGVVGACDRVAKRLERRHAFTARARSAASFPSACNTSGWSAVPTARLSTRHSSSAGIASSRWSGRRVDANHRRVMMSGLGCRAPGHPGGPPGEASGPPRVDRRSMGNNSRRCGLTSA